MSPIVSYEITSIVEEGDFVYVEEKKIESLDMKVSKKVLGFIAIDRSMKDSKTTITQSKFEKVKKKFTEDRADVNKWVPPYMTLGIEIYKLFREIKE